MTMKSFVNSFDPGQTSWLRDQALDFREHAVSFSRPMTRSLLLLLLLANLSLALLIGAGGV